MLKKNFLSNKFKIFATLFFMLFIFALLPLGSVLFAEAKSVSVEEKTSVKVKEENALLSSNGAGTLYIDPESKYGGADTNDGLSADTPIKTLDKAKELASPTASIYIMSTFYITTDTVIDMGYDTITFRLAEVDHWFSGETHSHVFNIGDSTGANVPTVVFDNFYFTADNFKDNDVNIFYVIYAFSCKLVFEENVVFNDMREQVIQIINTNNCDVVINGSSFIDCVTAASTFSFNNSEVLINDIYVVGAMARNGGVFDILPNSHLTINDGIFGIEGNPNTSHSFRHYYFSIFRVRSATGSSIIVNGGDFSHNKLGIFHDDSTVTHYSNKEPAIDIVSTSMKPWLVINGGVFSNNVIDSDVTDSEFMNYHGPSPSVGTIIDGGGNIVINGGIFENNSNVNAGGVINMYQGNLTINGGVFRNNSSTCGGAIYCNLVQNDTNTRTANIIVRNAEFIGNSVANNFTPDAESFNFDTDGELGGGAAIYTTQALTVINCYFEGNNVDSSVTAYNNDTVGANEDLKILVPGAIAVGIYTRCSVNKEIVVRDSRFINNINEASRADGGAIGYFQCKFYALAQRNETDWEITNCYFEGNYSRHVGGAVNIANFKMLVSDCDFIENESRGSGGAFRGSAMFLRCTFRRNITAGLGGAIDSYDSDIIECLIEENYSRSYGGGLGQPKGRLRIFDSIIRNNVDGEDVNDYEYAGVAFNDVYLYGKVEIYGNRTGAEVDSEEHPIIENGSLVGGAESNLYINGSIYVGNLDPDSVINFGIMTAPSDDSAEEIFNGTVPFVQFLDISVYTSDILDCFISDDPNYSFELRDGGIYLKKVGELTGNIVYTASDNTLPYDGRGHNIILNVIEPSNVTITYSLDGTSYSSEVPSICEIGTHEIYYRLTASGYTTEEGSRTLEITKNKVTIYDEDFFYEARQGAFLTKALLYYGENLTSTTDLTDRIKGGVAIDQYGNSVAGKFTPRRAYSDITFDTENIEVTFTPTNTEAYESCTFLAKVYFEYDELYFINGAFYLNSEASGVSIPASVGINKVLSYMTPQGAIYFSDTYDVTGEETIAVDKLVYLYRYKWRTSGVADEQVFNGEIFNITSSGSLSIGGGNVTDGTHMTGKLIIDGQGYATAGSTSPLIVNNGTLTITGNVEIKGGYNTNTIGPVSPGGAIYNGGTASLYGVVIRDCRYLNYLASTQFNGAGGGIFNASTGNLNMVGGRIDTCLARGGGAIYSEGVLSVTNTTFISNSAYSGAQVGTSSSSGLTIKLANGEANLVNILINKSRLSNGTNYYTNSSSNMTAEKLGGGIYVGINAKLTLVSSNLTQCYAYQGGGVYVDGTAYIFDTIIAACQAVNGGEGIAVGSQGRLTTVNIFISRCTSSNTPDASLGTNENGILTLTGGNTSLLSLSFEPGEAGGVITKTDNTRNKDYILGVVLALIVLGALVSFIVYLRTKTKKSKRE